MANLRSLEWALLSSLTMLALDQNYAERDDDTSKRHEWRTCRARTKINELKLQTEGRHHSGRFRGLSQVQDLKGILSSK